MLFQRDESTDVLNEEDVSVKKLSALTEQMCGIDEILQDLVSRCPENECSCLCCVCI